AEWLSVRMCGGPGPYPEARFPQTVRSPAPPPAMIDPPSSAADLPAEAELDRRRLSLTRVWQSLVRLPFVLGRLMFELLPVVVFVGIATLVLGTEIGDLVTTRLVILAVVNAYALSRGLICVVRALAGAFCPFGA